MFPEVTAGRNRPNNPAATSMCAVRLRIFCAAPYPAATAKVKTSRRNEAPARFQKFAAAPTLCKRSRFSLHPGWQYGCSYGLVWPIRPQRQPPYCRRRENKHSLFLPIQNYLTNFICNFLPSDALGQTVAPQPCFQAIKTSVWTSQSAVCRHGTPIQPAGCNAWLFPVKVRLLCG